MNVRNILYDSAAAYHSYNWRTSRPMQQQPLPPGESAAAANEFSVLGDIERKRVELARMMGLE